MDASERAAWLVYRQNGIGASDAPNLVGLGFADALKVYRDKVLPPDLRPPACGPLARGIALEPLVAARYAELMGVQLLAPHKAIYLNANCPVQFASPDRLRADNGRPVQLKTVGGFNEDWGPSGSEYVPDGYRVQVCQEAGCLGADSIDLAALDVLAWEFRVYRIAFDRELFDWLTGVELEFWNTHVVPRIPPTIEWEARYDPKKVGLIADRGVRVDLSATPGAAELFAQVLELKELKTEVEAAYDDARDRLAQMMGRAERADCGPWTVKKVIVGEVEVPAKPAHTKQGYTYLGKPTRRKGKS